MKQLLTINELIEDMERRGIRFTITSKEDAIEFLKNHNYYMKLAAYRKNYEKRTTGKKAGTFGSASIRLRPNRFKHTREKTSLR